MPFNTVGADLTISILLVLLHSLWQAAMIIVPTWIALKFLPARKHDLRYAVCLGSLAFVMLAVFATWSVVQHAAGQQVVAAPNDNAVETPQTSAVVLQRWLQTVAPGLIFIWGCGVVVMLSRTVRGLLEVRLLVHGASPNSESWPMLATLKHELQLLRRELSVKANVTLQVCERLASPAVAGTFWPVLLLPVNMLTTSNLSLEEWRIILAHELAHVRRLDVLVNFSQSLIECLLFFNPAVWWLNRQIRVEREACCDAIAARITGRPLSVAHTLLNVAAANHSTRVQAGSNVPTVTVAFAAETRNDELTDRVGRLANPAKAPGLQSRWIGLTWMSMSLSLLILCGVAIAVQQGTDAAVRTAIAFLSPQEQVDELARVQAKSIGVIAPMSDGSAATDIADLDQNLPIEFEVVLRSDESLPPADLISVNGQLEHTNGSTHIALGCEQDADKECRFTRSLQAGSLTVTASAKGFAPAVSRTILLRPGMESPTIELTLSRGFEKEVLVHDENGAPLSGIEVSVAAVYCSTKGTSGFAYHSCKLQSTDGRLAIPNVTDSEGVQYQMTVFQNGWESQNDTHQLTRDEPFILGLSKARPTTLTLIDRLTERPVPEANVQICGWNRGDHSDSAGPRGGDPRNTFQNGLIAGTSDSEGIAVVDTLHRDLKYLLAVHSEGFQPTLVFDVGAGQAHSIKLEQAIVFEGKVEGNLDLLCANHSSGRRRVPYLNYRNDLKYRSSGYSESLQVPVSEDGTFRISNLVGPTMSFSLPNGIVKLPSIESQNDIVLDLNMSAEDLNPMPMRDVEVHLTGLPTESLLRGHVEIWWNTPDNPRGNGSQIVPVRSLSASISLPIGAQFTVRPEGLVGCAFERQERRVAAGEGPQTEKIPVETAGGVFGTVRDSDGKSPGRLWVTLLALKDLGDRARNRVEIKTNDQLGTFFGSVPFDGEYIALVRRFDKSRAEWVVSKSFRIDREHPIQELHLQLNRGEPYRVTVLDDDEKPVANATVALTISHSVADGSHGQAVSARTNGNGVASFSVVREASSGPATLNLELEVSPVPGKTGWRGRVPIEESEFTVHVASGVSASGIVMDDATGDPLPNASVRVWPLRHDEAHYLSHILTTTDAQGRFEFRSLEPIEYRVMVEGTHRPGIVATKNANGGFSLTYPNGTVNEPTMIGGEDVDKEIRVLKYPRSN